MRPSVRTQVDNGWLVCPTTHARLRLDASALIGGLRPYPVIDDAPLFLGSGRAVGDVHQHVSANRIGERVAQALGLGDDGATQASRNAYQRVLQLAHGGALALNIGGGPGPGPVGFLNLNIFPAREVHVVADAAHLPYADGVVSAALCCAVLEHLRDPRRAVAELRRVMKSGGLVFAATPFMQGYHGVPDHYQNFTLTGHRALFEDAGFHIEEAGVHVGPMMALATLQATLVGDLTGSVWVRRAGLLLARVAAKLDAPLASRLHTENLASTTYVLARAP